MGKKKKYDLDKDLLLNSRFNKILFNLGAFIYDRLDKLYIIPIIFFILALLVPIYNYKSSGEFINKDFTLTGGLKISIANDDLSNLNNELFNTLKIKYNNLKIEETNGILNLIWKGSNYNLSEIKNFLKANGINNYNLEEVSPLLGKDFLRNLIYALLISLVFIVIVLYYIYKDISVASTAARALLFNIIITLFLTNLIIPLSINTLPAYLMILGYGIDTNITLINHYIKEKRLDKKDRYKSAFNTGVMMDLTTLVVLFIGIILANNLVLNSIFFVLFIGLLVDLLDTWLLNGYLLKKIVKN